MLITCSVAQRQQRGVVLLLALIVLVAMLLGGISLFRLVDTATLVSGNVAMQRNATRSADAGTEAAASWLFGAATTTTCSGGAVLTLWCNSAGSGGNGYVAAGMTEVPGANQTWADYWNTLVATRVPVTLATDSAGNTASYLIHRMCNLEGPQYSTTPAGTVSCVMPPLTSTVGGSMRADAIALSRPTSVYYRITTRVTGPRGSVSFIQTVINM